MLRFGFDLFCASVLNGLAQCASDAPVQVKALRRRHSPALTVSLSGAVADLGPWHTVIQSNLLPPCTCVSKGAALAGPLHTAARSTMSIAVCASNAAVSENPDPTACQAQT